MGLAMIAVILYHWCWACNGASQAPFLELFREFFFGVDIFMFLSGFGLCYAYQKYDLKQFWQRRAVRIYPMYAFLVLADYLTRVLPSSRHLSIWDWVCQFSTLQCYGVGGHFFDWFLSAILVLYAFFPLIYKKTAPWVPLFLLVAAWCFLNNIHVSWQKDCIISRLPIFTLGVLAHHVIKGRFSSRSFVTVCAFFVAGMLIPQTWLHRSEYLEACLRTPLLILIGVGIAWLLNRNALTAWLTKAVAYIGKHSLLVFAANDLALWCGMHYSADILFVWYWPLQIAWTPAMILLDRYGLQPLTAFMLNRVLPAIQNTYCHRDMKR